MPKGVYERQSVEERILAHITKDETTGCWVWNGTVDKDGYGQISYEHRTRHIHRVMYELKNGVIAKGMIAGHTCDDKYPKECILYRKCCNPEHIQPMTNKENIKRASDLGRLKITSGAFTPNQTGGENNIKAKLTAEQVIEIRRKSATKSSVELAEEYGIQYQTVYKIIKGILWNKPDYFPTPQ